MSQYDENECKVPPPGWRCSRPAGHDGPCAAYSVRTGESFSARLCADCLYQRSVYARWEAELWVQRWTVTDPAVKKGGSS